MHAPPGPTPLRLFLDSNILVSAAAYAGRERALLAHTEAGHVVAITTQHVLAEAVRVLTAKFGFSRERVDRFLTSVPFEVCRPPALRLIRQALALLRDPDDAPILAAAWEAGADALVTGDKDFLEAETDLRLRVLRTAEALELLGEG